jgi:hypothetical protein
MTSYTHPASSALGGTAASRCASEPPVQADWKHVLSHAESCSLLFLNGNSSLSILLYQLQAHGDGHLSCLWLRTNELAFLILQPVELMEDRPDF